MKIVKIPKLSKEIQIIPFEKRKEGILSKYYEEGVQAGFPSPAEDLNEHKLSLDDKYIEDSDSTYLIRVVGNSMYPTLIQGDLLIVKAELELIDDTIAIISVNNTDFTVKRFSKEKKLLIADNNTHPNIPIEEEDTIMCLGIVKHLIRDL